MLKMLNVACVFTKVSSHLQISFFSGLFLKTGFFTPAEPQTPRSLLSPQLTPVARQLASFLHPSESPQRLHELSHQRLHELSHQRHYEHDSGSKEKGEGGKRKGLLLIYFLSNAIDDWSTSKLSFSSLYFLSLIHSFDFYFRFKNKFRCQFVTFYFL